ncbi:hypothetical protein RclHR1_00500002 [Rhizophagus clarus]|uniref:RNase H type-1 domain-containing protein n=1 Tax=Rhizophagus clarus TaxID=94130 RepID=A0A2Z6RLE1_9GLOM|nr:hypothetical protein RclHR1_00500002 [Rhizophagus clarus]
MNTYSIWSLFFWLIQDKNLILTFVKVPAHSGDPYNDQAELLLKNVTNLTPIFFSPKSDPSAMMTATFNYLGPLYGNLRKWSQRACHAQLTTSQLYNRSQQHILNLLSTYTVDWSLTSRWLQKNNDNGSLCSFHNNTLTGHKIKLYTHLLLMADIQQRNFPCLYPSCTLLCTECHSQVYDNSHIGFYPAHLNNFNHNIQQAATYLCSLITLSHSVLPVTSGILPSIDRSPLFALVIDINHLVYLLLHQLVLKELVSLISIHIRSKKEAMEIISTFIQYFYTQITRKY